MTMREVTLGFEVSSVEGVTLGSQATATVTLIDDDAVGLAVPSAVRVAEDGSATYAVALATQPTDDVTVTVTLPIGTDLELDKATLTFTPQTWATAQEIEVSANADDDAVDDVVTLTHAASGGGYDDVEAATKVTVDDDTPTLSVADVRAGEDAGEMVFAVALSVASSHEVTVDYATSDGTAAAGSDYTAVSGTLTFAPGSTAAQEVRVAIAADAVDEAEEERFALTLSNAANAGLAGGGTALSATGTIDDDDDPAVTVAFDVASYEAVEGGEVVVTVQLSAAPERIVEVPLTATVTGGATAQGEPDEDYTGIPVSLTFGADETQKTFTVTAVDDSVDDDDEGVTLGFEVSSLEGVTLGSQATATVTLLDNDNPEVTVAFDVASYEAVEGGAGVVVTVQLSAAPEREVEVSLTATVTGGATAQGESNPDYTGIPVSLTFGADETQKTFTVTPLCQHD